MAKNQSGGFLLADTGEVKDNKEEKYFDIETMMDEFLAVQTMKTVLMSLAMVLCMVVESKYIVFLLF